MNTRIRFALLLAVAGVITLGGSVLAAAGGDSDIGIVRQVTARFHDVDAAKAAGYELGYVNGAGNRIITGCIAHPTAGVMGYHYFNKQLIDDLVVDEQQPEGLVYTSGPEGQLKLVAVEYVVPGAGSNPPGLPATDDLRQADAHPRPGRGLLHPARLGLESQPGRDVRGLEPRAHVPIACLH